MKAAFYNQYGTPEVISIKEVAAPAPQNNQVQVQIKAAAVTIADSRIRAARFPQGFGFFARLAFGFSKPRNNILGSCFSGVVTQVGSSVTKFKVGDEVFGMTGGSFGAHAQFIVIAETGALIKKPQQLTHPEAAAMPFGATTALYFIRDKAKLQQGQTILINGASGAVGTNAIQLAKYYGATVTAVCSSANIDLVKSLGADKVIDYTKQDLNTSKTKYDVVLDAVGNVSMDQAPQLLKQGGKLLMVVAGLNDMIKSMFKFGNYKFISGTAPETASDLDFLTKLMVEGKLKAVLDKTYKLSEIVEAHRHVDSGHKRGNVVIKMD